MLHVESKKKETDRKKQMIRNLEKTEKSQKIDKKKGEQAGSKQNIHKLSERVKKKRIHN